MGIVADTGGLNDHGFNHLAYEGSIEAHKMLGVKTQVTQAQSSSQYVPLLTKEAENGDNLVVAVGFDFIDALGSGREAVPAHKVRDHRHAGLGDQGVNPRTSRA